MQIPIGSLGVREGARRPFHELREVVEKRGLHLILVEPGRSCLGAKLESGSQQQDQAEHACHVSGAQKRHVIFPKMLR